MAVSGITGSNSILLSALGSRVGGFLRQAATLQEGQAQAAAAAPRNLNAAPANASQITRPLQTAATQLPEAATSPSRAGLSEAPLPLQAAIPQQNVSLASLPAATPLAEPPEQTAAAVLQNALLVNEGLRELEGTAAEPEQGRVLETASPLLTVLAATRELNPVEENALRLNEALAALGCQTATPANPLAIGAVPAALEAADITEELDVVQQTGLLVNETLEDLGPTAEGTTQPLTAEVTTVTTPAGETFALAGEEAAAASQAAGTTLATAGEPAAAPAETATAAAAAEPTAAATTAVAAAAEETLPVAATFLTELAIPARLPQALSISMVPYVHAIYQPVTADPRATTPEPVGREVSPTPPIPASRPVGNARYRRALLRGGEGGGPRPMEYGTRPTTVAQAERSIRQTLDRINADMAAHDLPLHLVFARHEEGFAVDVYDCSFNEVCRLTYDVPISLDNLSGLLDSLEHETGIIVDTTS